MTFSRATFTTPAPPEGHARVASCDVSRSQLAAWGFPIRSTEQMMGATIIMAEGFTVSEAAQLAAEAGFTFVAIESSTAWDARRAARKAARRAEHAHMRATAAESLAWVRANA